MKKKTHGEIEIHCEDVQEIISRVPAWISRWGITVIAIFIFSLLALSSFIKYPDIIDASVEITSSPPPITLVARTTANIQLIKTENSFVKKDEVVAILKSNSDFENVISLGELLSKSDNFAMNESYRTWTLGDLYPAFNAYLNSIRASETNKALNSQQKKIEHLTNQSNSYRKLENTMVGQLELMKIELTLAKKSFTRDSILFIEKVISEKDYNVAESSHLQVRRSHKTAESSVTNNEIQLGIILSAINELKIQQKETEAKLEQEIRNSKNELRAQIAKWKDQYLIISPVAGKVAFLHFIDDGMYIEAGKELFSIVPHATNIFAKAEIPISGSGKVKVGQHVNMQLKNYPHQQYGMIRGKILRISEVAFDDNYLAIIEIPNPLITTYNKELPFKQQLKADTQIITEDLSILDRVLYQFRLSCHLN